MTAGVDETGLLTAALSELSDLSQAEYCLSLSELLEDVKRKDEEAILAIHSAAWVHGQAAFCGEL